MPVPKISFFPKPFPPGAPAWQSLTAEQQFLWSQWAAGNPVGDTDFRSVMREGQTAWQIVSTNQSTQEGFSLSQQQPLAPAQFLPGAPVTRDVFDTTAEEFFWKLQTTIDTQGYWQFWASPPYYPDTPLSLSQTKFIGAFTFIAANPVDWQSPNFWEAYNAAFPGADLVTNQRILCFLWQQSQGSLLFAGSFPFIIED